MLRQLDDDFDALKANSIDTEGSLKYFGFDLSLVGQEKYNLGKNVYENGHSHVYEITFPRELKYQ